MKSANCFQDPFSYNSDRANGLYLSIRESESREFYICNAERKESLNRHRSGEPPSMHCFIRPLFRDVLMHGWVEMLLLPPEFGSTIADKVGKETKLKNAFRDKWRVTLSSYHGSVAFHRGWKNFVDNHKLEEHDLLVFRSVDNGSRFKVEVYGGTSFCEKACHRSLIRTWHGGQHGRHVPVYRNEHPSVCRFFTPLLRDWDEQLLLPPEFAATIADKVGQEAKLENALGEKWTVTLSSYRGRLVFKRGWKDFITNHNIEEGDLLVFRSFKDGSQFQVEVYDGTTFCEKACRRSLKRTQHIEQHRRHVPVDSDAGAATDSSFELPSVGSPPLESRVMRSYAKSKRDTSFELPNADLGSPPLERRVTHSYAKRKRDTSSELPNANLGSPPLERRVTRSYAKRKRDTSFELPNADLGSPPLERRVTHSYSKRKRDTSFELPNADFGSPPLERHVTHSYAKRKRDTSFKLSNEDYGLPPLERRVSRRYAKKPIIKQVKTEPVT